MMFCWRWSLSHWVFVYLDLFFFCLGSVVCHMHLHNIFGYRDAPKANSETRRWRMPTYYVFLVLVSSGAKWCEGLYFRDPFWHHLGDFGRHFGTSWAPRGSQNRPFWHQVAPKNQRKKLSRKSATIFCARAAFWRHLGDFGRPLADFGRHLGPSWPPRGSQNPPFWHQVAPTSQKMNPKMRHQKMHKNLIEILWKKCKFWMCSSHRTIMYKGILVVGAFYERIKKLMKKWCQKGPKIDAKINILVIRGPTFDVLGHVFLRRFFYDF